METKINFSIQYVSPEECQTVEGGIIINPTKLVYALLRLAGLVSDDPVI